MTSKISTAETATVQSIAQSTVSRSASTRKDDRLARYFNTQKKYLVDQTQLQSVLLRLVVIIYTILITSFCYFAIQ